LIRTTTGGAITDALAIAGTFDRASFTRDAAIYNASVNSVSFLKESAACTAAGTRDLPHAVVPSSIGNAQPSPAKMPHIPRVMMRMMNLRI
jgi:hypothetical protein